MGFFRHPGAIAFQRALGKLLGNFLHGARNPQALVIFRALLQAQPVQGAVQPLWGMNSFLLGVFVSDVPPHGHGVQQGAIGVKNTASNHGFASSSAFCPSIAETGGRRKAVRRLG